MFALGRTHTQTQSLILASFFFTDPRHAHKVINRGKGPVLCPLVDNRLGHRRPDARKRL